MTRVPWAEASRYFRWAGGRLPTEDEWRYAAPGGGAGPYTGGSEEPACVEGAATGARSDDRRKCPLAGPAPVRPFAANGFGHFDMAGNVWERCDDEWSGTPFGGCQGRPRVVRGGGWSDDASMPKVGIPRVKARLSSAALWRTSRSADERRRVDARGPGSVVDEGAWGGEDDVHLAGGSQAPGEVGPAISGEVAKDDVVVGPPAMAHR